VVPVVFAGFERLRLPAFLRRKDADGTAAAADASPESESGRAA